MSRFYIVSESTDDTLGSADNLPEAMGAAKEAARRREAGDLVSVLGAGGKPSGSLSPSRWDGSRKADCSPRESVARRSVVKWHRPRTFPERRRRGDIRRSR